MWLLFEPVRSRDLSGEVHFSIDRGNVEFYSFEQEAPIATHVLVVEDGELRYAPEQHLRGGLSLQQVERLCERFLGYVPDGIPNLVPEDEVSPAEVGAVFRAEAGPASAFSWLRAASDENLRPWTTRSR